MTPPLHMSLVPTLYGIDRQTFAEVSIAAAASQDVRSLSLSPTHTHFVGPKGGVYLAKNHLDRQNRHPTASIIP